MSVSTTPLPFEQPAPDSPQERKRREEKVHALLGQADDEAISRGYDTRLATRLYGFVQPYRWKVLAATIWMAATTMLAVSGPWIIGKAVDEGLRTGNMQALRTWTLLFGAAATAEWFCNRQRIMIMAFVGTRVVADVRRRLFRHLHALSLNFHNNVSVGRLMSRLIGDVGVLQDFVTWTITGTVRAVFILVGVGIAMLLLNWVLALVAFADAAADDHAHHLLAPPRARGLPCHALAPVADQRLSQRVDPGHPRHPELPPRAPQHRPFRRPQPLLLRRQHSSPPACPPSSSPASTFSARLPARW